jgi:hypothetical protein
VATTTVPGGTAGGASDAFVYVIDQDFDETVADYRQNLGDADERPLVDRVVRFDTDDDCILLIPWETQPGEARQISVNLFRKRLRAEDLGLLDSSRGSFIEDRPRDCSFRG